MPIYRGPDGKIIEERTRKVRDQGQPTRKVNSPDLAAASPVNEIKKDEEKTRRLNEPAAESSAKKAETAKAGPATDDERTHLAGTRARAAAKSQMEALAEDDTFSDPVVGWLVVTKGPGKGRSHQLGFGANSIGRGEGERIRLDYGDNEISRHGHAVLVYDPRGNTFYLQNGNSLNLTYLNNEPVLSPCTLKERCEIQLGNTTLCFVPLCSTTFNWLETDN